MPVLAAQNVARSYNADLILEDVTFQVDEGQRIGVVGPNGAGKTTLFKLLLGVDKPDTGDVSRAKSTKISYFAQHNVFTVDRTVIEETMQAFAGLFEIEAKLRELEHQMAETADANALDKLVKRHSELHDAFERGGGWELRPRAEAVLLGLGVGEEMFERSVKALSGGEAGRVALAKLLLAEADVLLLDEPTNHLDIGGCEWLEDYLAKTRTTSLVISHDRYFLDRVTTHTLELEDGRATIYPGAYSKFEYLKEEQKKAYEREYDLHRDFIKKEKEFIRKHLGSQRSREAKGRQRRLERLERMAAPAADREAMKLGMKPKRPLGKQVFDVENLAFGYGDRLFFSNFEMTIGPGERVGIMGPNGAGKTTLLKILLGQLEPKAGIVKRGQTIDVGYYDQMHKNLDRNSTVFDVIAGTDLDRTEEQTRAYLARFLFFDEELPRKVSALSGGERGRLSLAKLLLERPNVLVLDEPTNHLDILSRQALEEALSEYPGTIIAVSHDRYFIDKLCEKVVWIDGGAQTYLGNYSYAAEKRRTAAAALEAERARKKEDERERQKKADKAAAAKPKDKKSRPVERIESDLAKKEAEKARLMAAMEDPDTYRDQAKMKSHKDALAKVSAEIRALEGEWERAVDS